MEEGGKFESIEKGGSVKGPQKCESSPATARTPDVLSAAALRVQRDGRNSSPRGPTLTPSSPRPPHPWPQTPFGHARPVRTLTAVEGWLIILTGLHEETQEDDIHDKFCDFGDTAWSKCPPWQVPEVGSRASSGRA